MILEKKIHINPQIILSLFIGSFFVLDILNKFNFSESQPWSLLIKLGKSLFYVLFLVCVLNHKKLVNIKIGLGVLVMFFIINQSIFYNSGLISKSDLIPSIRYLVLLLFPLILSSYLVLQPKPNTRIFENVFYGIVILVVFSTLIGFIWEIKFFKTYNDRFGYLGLIPKSITASYFYIAALSLLYYKYLLQSQKKLKWLFFITFLSSFLAGTKAIYLYNFMLLAFTFYQFRWYKKMYIYALIALAISMFFIFRENLYKLGEIYFTPLVNLYENKSLITALTSFRDEIFISNVSEYSTVWNWYNHLIGGKINSIKLYESSIMDLYSFFGIIGSIVYLWVYFKNMNVMISHRISFVQFFLISTFLISILAGQFFLNISAISYIIITFYLINSNNEKF